MDVMLLLSFAMGGGVSNGGRVEGGWSRPSRPPATEDRFESGGQRSSPERLGDEVIGAELEDADLIVFVALGGQHHHWNFPSGKSEEHTSELQSRRDLVCRLLLEKKNN